MTVGSALDNCSLCLQQKTSVCAEFCGSEAAEVGSKKLWIMIEFSNDLQIICHNSGISLGWPTFKGKQVGCA